MAQLPDKVLRIGVVIDGRIAHERLIRPGTDVTLGESARNTFVLPEIEGLPKTTLLFPKRRGGWSLRFTHDMEGKIAHKRSVVPLDSLLADARRRDDGFVLPLGDDARGKLLIHPRVSVLFQFVPAPPDAVRVADKSFRPQLLDDDDPVYLGFLGLFSAVAAVAMIWVWGQTPIERVGFEGIEDRFVHDVLIIQAPEIEPVEIEPTLQDDAPPEPIDEGDQAILHDDGPPEPLFEGSDNTRTDEAMAAVEAHPLIATLGNSTFDVEQGSIFDPKDEAFDRMLAGLAYVEGEEFASEAGLGARGCTDCSGDDEGIGALGMPKRTHEIRVHTGGSVQIDADRNSIVRPPDAPTTGPDVGGLIAAFGPHIRTCYEQALNRSPTARGRVELALGIEGGTTYGVDVILNTTGDPKLEQCIESKAQRWKFPADIEADVVRSYVLNPRE